MTTLDRLVTRFARAEVAWLRRWFGRELDDNPGGQALLAAAIERATRLGIDGWGKPSAPEEAEGDDALWRRWQAQRELTPEAERWPERLGEAGGREAERTLAAAEELLLDAGTELGMAGGGLGGRRGRRAMIDVGRQSAEAGAALAHVLTAPPEPAAEPPPRATPAEPMRIQPIPDAVKVATTSNLAECELLQGMLAQAGIPSSWRRAVMDIPELLAAGDRDVFVPASRAEEARTVLATVTDPPR